MTQVLVDTSVWVAHFRSANRVLRTQLVNDRVLCHPLIVLEIACGAPPAPRAETLGDLQQLRPAVVANAEETLALTESERLYESGCGAVDVALLASVLLTPEAQLWTADKRLAALAARFGVAFSPSSH